MCLAPPGPGPPASKLRALRLSCVDLQLGASHGLVHRLLDVQKYITGMAPQCPNLTTIHLRGVIVEALPALPQLAHLVLDHVPVSAALLASLQGLPSLQTLAVLRILALDCCLDLASLTQLRRVSVQHSCLSPTVEESFKAGWDIALPPGCKLALQIPVDAYHPATHWLVRHCMQLESLKLLVRDMRGPCVTGRVFPYELSHLKHVTVQCSGRDDRGVDWYVCVSVLFGWLPASVERLSLVAQHLGFDSSRVEVPANLRALHLSADRASMVDSAGGESEITCVLTFCVHAGLSRVSLWLGEGEVALECADKQVAAGIQELYVRAGSVVLDAHMQAEVAARGQLQTVCEWGTHSSSVLCDKVVHIGAGPWPKPLLCACGACCQCLGVFGRATLAY